MLERQFGNRVRPDVDRFLCTDEGLISRGHVMMPQFEVVDVHIGASKIQCGFKYWFGS